MSKMGQELERKLGETKYDMYEALQGIAEGKGAYSRDPLTHCSNTVDNMKGIARDTLIKIEGNRWCPECGEYKPDDERVISGMKCQRCSY